MRRIFSAAEQKPLIVFARLFALVFIIASTTISQRIKPADYDFSQFYMGGLTARLGEWNALYPVPKPGSAHNPGLSRDSDLKPETARLAAEAQVPRTEFHFIQLPVVALLLAPLSLLSYHQALWLWILLAGCFSAMTAIFAGEIFGLLSDDAGWKQALVIVVVAISHFAYRSVRVTNASALIGFCIAWAAYEIIRERNELPRSRWLAAVPILVGGIFKYVTIIFLPILIAQRAWRTLLWVAITGLLLVLLSMTVTGIGVYREFSSTILPLLNRPCAEPDNQCLAGAVLRAMSKQPPLPTSAQNALAIAQCLVLATILVGVFARLWNDDSPHRPAELAASVAAMTAWLLLFSPVSWDHYYVYTCGLWGWLIFEAGQTGFRRILIICIALVWPIDTAGMAGLHGNLPWPLNEHLQFGLLLMMVVALLRLFAKDRTGERKGDRMDERRDGGIVS